MMSDHSQPENPYAAYVRDLADHVRAAASLPLGGLPLPQGGVPSTEAPAALLFSPHPDDECVTGLLPLRLMREAGMRVLNVPVTYGSAIERRTERHAELRGACAYLGWDVVEWTITGERHVTACRKAPMLPAEGSLDFAPLSMARAVEVLQELQPAILFLPHVKDWNIRHVETHDLVMSALREMPMDFHCTVVETEFWGAMATPNLMVEGDANLVADLVAATSFHVKEVERNPYHRLLPAWMMDTVRRGGELVGGQGQGAPAFDFATLYRVQRWQQGALHRSPKPLPYLPLDQPAVLTDL